MIPGGIAAWDKNKSRVIELALLTSLTRWVTLSKLILLSVHSSSCFDWIANKSYCIRLPVVKIRQYRESLRAMFSKAWYGLDIKYSF